MAMMPMSTLAVPVNAQLVGFQGSLMVPVAAVVVNVPASPCGTPCSTSISESEASMSRQNSEESEQGICLEGSVAGRVWDLSQRSKGCRYVQAALENCGDGERFTLALELQGHVLAAARSACANYVLQKIIQVLRPQACQFIIDEIMKTPADVPILARHQYGCRILQRLLEHCQAQQMEGLVKLLLEDATALVRHNYGTFVMQQIFDFGTEVQRQQLGECLFSTLGAMGNDENATQVLQKALIHAPQKVALARAMVPQLAQIARGRHSHHTVLAAVQLLSPEDSKRAIALLSQKLQKLWASRYGRLVVKAIPSLHDKCMGMTKREAAAA